MHLSDCFLELMAYVGYLLKSVETTQPPYDEVKNEIRRLMSASEGYPARGEVARDDFDLARFALCAWIDEAILSSRWRHKNRWLSDQLQRLHYNTTDAGEEFFLRLEGIGLQQRELREVYYLCLALGFSGRYCHAGDDSRLEQIKNSHLKILLGAPTGVPSLEQAVLFPEARAGGEPKPCKPQKAVASRLVNAVCLAAPAALFCILYLVYHFTLSGISENFLRTVTN